MTDYSKGQIYKVVDNGLNLCYIGSTVQPLCKRMSGHRIHYKKLLKENARHVAVYDIFEKYGVENCKIIWVEDYPCNSKKDLEAQEGKHQKETDCVNKRVAGRDKKQNYQDKREYYLEKSQIYRGNHREESKEYFKQRYIDKKDEIIEKRKEHRQNNLEKVREQERQSYQRNKLIKQRPYTCECGATMCFSAKSRHQKTQKHRQYLQSLE